MENLVSLVFVDGDIVQTTARILVFLIVMEVFGSIFNIIGNIRFK